MSGVEVDGIGTVVGVEPVEDGFVGSPDEESGMEETISEKAVVSPPSLPEPLHTARKMINPTKRISSTVMRISKGKVELSLR